MAAATIDYTARRARDFANEISVIAEMESILDPEFGADGFALADKLTAAADELDELGAPGIDELRQKLDGGAEQ
jgi:hypothetical protein